MIRTVLRYTPDWNRIEARCVASVWPPSEQRPGLVVVSEQADNPGASITNAIECVADVLLEQGIAEIGEGFRLVEHYPASSWREATYDVVTLRRIERDVRTGWCRFAAPGWRRVDAAALDGLAPAPPPPSEALRAFEESGVRP